MGTTLDNGIYLPDKGERNCYEGLAGNWVALDNHLGSTDIHVTINDKQAWDGHVADTTIHVTSADKQAWNGKADASALTAHTGDTTIHVTAEDKTKWDAVTSKADDSDVVHKSGDETIGGVKSFSDNISTKKIISNVAQLQINARSSADSVAVIAGTNASDGSGIWLYGKDNATGSDCRIQIYNTAKSRFERVDLVNSQFLPSPSGELDCGGTSNKWKSFNGLNPSSLSMPDLDNGIDISGYLTKLNKSLNTYTPPVNGWIEIELGRSALPKISMRCRQTDGLIHSTETSEFSSWGISFPVIGGKGVSIYLYADSLSRAKFYPCLGNV